MVPFLLCAAKTHQNTQLRIKIAIFYVCSIIWCALFQEKCIIDFPFSSFSLVFFFNFINCNFVFWQIDFLWNFYFIIWFLFHMFFLCFFRETILIRKVIRTCVEVQTIHSYALLCFYVAFFQAQLKWIFFSLNTTFFHQCV